MRREARERLDQRTTQAFEEEERAGLMAALRVRLVALIFILLWQAIDSPDTGLTYVYNLSVIATFIALGGVHFVCILKRWRPVALSYVFVALDCAFMAYFFSAPPPFESTPLPPAILMDSARFLYFFMFLMQATFSFRPTLVIWSGACIVIARAGMWLWFAARPETYTNLDLEEQTVEAWLSAGADLDFLFLGYAATELIVVLIITAGLAVVVSRSRRMVRTRLSAERVRASLARYFSPNVADRLSRSGMPFTAPRRQNVAVLFADVIGFTRLCEDASPEDVVDLLKGYHDRLGEAVFEHDGTLDKYIGDGMMATFGTPDATPLDAANALTCAFDMIARLDSWNEERRAMGLQAVRVGIGLHYGPVIVGDIGNERRLEYGVIGDTVNIASRLEHLTRELGASLVVSKELVDAIGPDDHRLTAQLKRLTDGGEQEIRGRAGRVQVWTLTE